MTYNLFVDEMAPILPAHASLVCERVCMCVFVNVIKAPGENLFSIVVVISAVLIWTVTALLPLPAMMP